MLWYGELWVVRRLDQGGRRVSVGRWLLCCVRRERGKVEMDENVFDFFREKFWKVDENKERPCVVDKG